MSNETADLKTDSTDGTSSTGKERVSLYAWYVSVLLALFFVFSGLDRQIIGVLVPDMKAELNLTDVQISYVGGLSLVLCLTLFVIPLGRMADIYSRRKILFIGVVIWTLATSACGIASGYWQLIALRMGVGIGEATLAPCAYSMVADIFPKHRLATAMGILNAGAAFGFGFAFLGGALVLGWATELAGDSPYVLVPLLGELTPWRVVFLAVGLAGLVLPAMLFTVKDPVRRGASIEIPSIKDVMNFIWQNRRGYLGVIGGVSCINLSSYASSFWDITFLDRSYGWAPIESGISYGIAATAGQFGGTLAAGMLADYVTRRYGTDSQMKILLGIAFFSFWLRIIYPFMPTSDSSFMVMIPIFVLNGAPYGVAAAALQIMTPTRMRAQITAVYIFCITVIGLGLGPTAVALLTEHVFQDLQMLNYSLAITGGVCYLFANVLFYRGSRPYLQTVEISDALNRAT